MPFCKHCGKEMSADVIVCPNCGQSSKDQQPAANATAPPGYNPYKNPTTAALIAIIGGLFGFTGIGHIYAGKIGKGIIILISGIVLFAVGILTLFILIGIPLLIAYVVLWIWQIFDARTTARKFNERVQATGKEPW